MASVAINDRLKMSNANVSIGDITIGTYATNGVAVTAAQFGMNTLKFVLASPTAGYVFQYDYANQKLKAYYADYDGSADGALIEVANSANLGSVVARTIAVGY